MVYLQFSTTFAFQCSSGQRTCAAGDWTTALSELQHHHFCSRVPFSFALAPKFLLIIDGAGIFRRDIKQNPRRRTPLLARVCTCCRAARYKSSMDFGPNPVFVWLNAWLCLMVVGFVVSHCLSSPHRSSNDTALMRCSGVLGTVPSRIGSPRNLQRLSNVDCELAVSTCPPYDTTAAPSLADIVTLFRWVR